VVDGKVVCEIVARLQERAQRHALRFLAGCAGAVEEVPGLAEVVVLVRVKESADFFLARRRSTRRSSVKTYKQVHVLRHPIIHPKLRRAHFRQFFLLLLRRRCGGCWLALLGHAVGFHLAESVFYAHVV
jgi:hypothetical protein